MRRKYEGNGRHGGQGQKWRDRGESGDEDALEGPGMWPWLERMGAAGERRKSRAR